MDHIDFSRKTKYIHVYTVSTRHNFLWMLAVICCFNALIQVMTNLINECLKRASNSKFKTIAFPAIGTGVLGVPPDKSAEWMFAAAAGFSESISSTSVRRVYFVVYDTNTEVLQVTIPVVMKLCLTLSLEQWIVSILIHNTRKHKNSILFKYLHFVDAVFRHLMT